MAKPAAELECTLERNALLKAMSIAPRVVERRTTIPILTNVKLVFGAGRLAITATDLDIQAEAAAEAQVTAPGAITVPAHTFYDIVRKIPEGAQIALAKAPGTYALTIRAGRSRFSLQALDAADFPDLAAGEFPTRFRMPAAQLSRMIGRAAFAISTEETRYYLNGIFLEAADGQLFAVATDGHRLARISAPVPDGADGMAGVIIPRKTVVEVARLLQGLKDEAVTVEIGATKVRFTFPGTPPAPGVEGLPVVLTSKLVDGTFPDYRRVIPTANSKLFRADRLALAAAVDRVGTVATERGRAVKFDFAAEAVTLTVTNPDAGVAEDELAGTMQGEPVTIGFNGRYFADTLAAAEGETTLIKLADAGSPTLFSAEGDDTALFVLMPMRV